MPAGDGTGPMGMGAMTGRAGGFCAGYATPGYMNPAGGRGMGMGFGRGGGRGMGGGRGRRNMFYATGLTGWQRGVFGAPGWGAAAVGAMPAATAPSREQQLEAMKDQAGYFEDALSGLRKRIEELEVEKK